MPSPVQEPSASRAAELQDQMKRSGVKAVFVEPQLVEVSRVLKRVADDLGVRVCRLYSDSYDKQVTSYETLQVALAAGFWRPPDSALD